ncbi:MAG: ABC transporter permease [Succinatimonas sp.]|nr:ABC transporter permease [Succinatimonas sp.]
MNTINAMKMAFCEEIEVMRSGHSMPYHKLSLMVSLVTAIVFSILLQHQVVFDGHIAVIDLDSSSYSRELIQKLDASSYIEIIEVYRNPVNVSALLMHDRNIGVLYIPKNLEKNLMNGQRSMKLGYYADYTNSAQNGVAIETLNEIISEQNATVAAPKIAAMGSLSGDATANMLSPMSLGIRRLSDPVYSSTNAFVIAITIFFSSLYLGLSTLMITGRINVTGQFERCLKMGVASWFARLMPYVFFYATGLCVAFCVLINFGQLRFEGNWLFYLLTIITTGMCIGMIALILSWNSSNPGSGAGFMILFVPPGFILGGSTMAIPFLTDWVKAISDIWPLVWQYSFLRDIAQRGEFQLGVVGVYGCYLVYASILALVLIWRWHGSMKKMQIRQAGDVDALHFEPNKN